MNPQTQHITTNNRKPHRTLTRFKTLLAGLIALLTLFSATPSMAQDGKAAYNTGLGLSLTGTGLFVLGTALQNEGRVGYAMTALAPVLVAPGSLLVVKGARKQGAEVKSTMGWTSVALWGLGEVLMVNAALNESWGLGLAGYATLGLSAILGMVQVYTATRALERVRSPKGTIQFKKKRKVSVTPYSSRGQRGLALIGQF